MKRIRTLEAESRSSTETEQQQNRLDSTQPGLVQYSTPYRTEVVTYLPTAQVSVMLPVTPGIFT